MIAAVDTFAPIAVESLDLDQLAARRAADDDRIRRLGETGRFGAIAKPLAEMLGRVETISVRIPEDLRGGFIPSTPSVCLHEGERRAIVRGVNYRQTVDQRALFDEEEPKCRTRDWWVELNADWSIRAVRTMEDPHPERPGSVQGYEDCRLFWSGGSYRASCTFAERPRLFGDGAWGLLCEMALLDLSPEGEIRRVQAIRGPWSVYNQKNWKPAPSWREPLRWIYASEPLTLLTPEMAAWPLGPRWATAQTWRGGSQAVPVTGGWLWIDHRPVLAFDGPRNLYLHRFVLADAKIKRIKAVSEPFIFQGYQVEFCAGLAIDEDRVVLSYSVKDAFSLLAICSLDSVMGSLRAVQP